jgi:hypothetical protein
MKTTITPSESPFCTTVFVEQLDELSLAKLDLYRTLYSMLNDREILMAY